MSNQQYYSKQNNLVLTYSESHLESMLDHTNDFINAYKTVLPNAWYFFELYVDTERTSYGPSLFVEKGFVVFKITIGDWWDELLRQFPDVEDYMIWVFKFDPQEKAFVASMVAGECENQVFPTSTVVGMIQQSLNNYETKHPEVHFQRQNWGARIGNV